MFKKNNYITTSPIYKTKSTNTSIKAPCLSQNWHHPKISTLKFYTIYKDISISLFQPVANLFLDIIQMQQQWAHRHMKATTSEVKNNNSISNMHTSANFATNVKVWWCRAHWVRLYGRIWPFGGKTVIWATFRWWDFGWNCPRSNTHHIAITKEGFWQNSVV